MQNKIPLTSLGIYTRYHWLGASSRCRYYWYRDAFRAAGFQPEFHPLLPDAYLRKLYAGKGKSAILGAVSLGRRLLECSLQMPRRLLIEYELFPGLPWRWERFFLASRRYVLNFDDNVWEKYRGVPKLEEKYDQLVRHAAGVIVANDFLEEKVRALGARTIKIPTVVSLRRFRSGTYEKYPRFTLVWIGTPVTYVYLEKFAEVFRRLAEKMDFDLLVLAKKSLESRRIPGVNMRFEDWSEEREVEFLRRSHLGVMPLPDDDFSRGKSAFKLIEYHAAGIPAIASPVGENCRVIHPGQDGFLARNSAEWVEAVCSLNKNSTLYKTMCEAAAEAAEAYSVERYSPIYGNFLREVLNEQ